MAAPGFGDVILMMQMVYGVYRTCKDAPDAVVDAMADVKQMKTELESMEQKVNDPKSFIYKNQGKMLARVKETFEPLIEGLKTMQELIKEYKRIPQYSGQKLIYAYIKVPIIKDVQASFVKYRDIYSSAFQHIGAEADAHNAAQLDEMAVRNTQLKKDLDAMKKEQKVAAKLQKDGNSKMDQLLKGLEALNANQSATPNAEVKLPEQWEVQLRAAGLKDKEIERIMAALKFDAIPPINVMPSPGSGKAAAGKDTPEKGTKDAAAGGTALKVPSRPRASSQPRNSNKKPPSPGPEPGKKRAPSPSPSSAKPPSLHPKSPSPKPTSKASSPKVPSGTEDIRILCVDRTNGLRSIQAQVYLQLVRLWTANASTPPGHTWLFQTVSSAGLNRPSTLATSAKIPIYTVPKPAILESAICAIEGPTSYFWSDNYPFEKSEVLKRVKAHEAKGIAERDLVTYDYILCFTGDLCAELVQLVEAAKNRDGGHEVKVKVVMIPGTEWFISSRHTSPAEIEEVTGNLKNGLKAWLTKVLGWKRPVDQKSMVSTIDGIQGRTLQIILPRAYKEVLAKRKNKIKAGKTKELEGCWIRWETVGKEDEQLVSITGRKEKLKEAEAWIRGLC